VGEDLRKPLLPFENRIGNFLATTFIKAIVSINPYNFNKRENLQGFNNLEGSFNK
jgi:hypothetical protein